MHELGASVKTNDVYEKFDITTDAVVRASRAETDRLYAIRFATDL